VFAAGLDVDAVGNDEIEISYVGDHAGQARRVSGAVAVTGLGAVLEDAGARARRDLDAARGQVADIAAGIEAIFASTGGREPSALRQAEDAELMALKQEQAAARDLGDSSAVAALEIRVAEAQETVLDLGVLVRRYDGLLARQGDAEAALSAAEARARQVTAALRPERLASSTSIRDAGAVRRPLGLWRPLLALIAVLGALGLAAMVFVMRGPAPSPVLATIETAMEAGQATVPAEPASHQRAPISGRALVAPFLRLDGGPRPGVATEERQRVADLARQVSGLRRATEILNAAEDLLARELDLRRPTS
jgi:hypothetical protein